MVRTLVFDYNECLKLGLLRRIPPSKENALNSLKEAEKWLNEAGNNVNSNSHNSALINSYLAMFHSARAILFLDGLREKSHACIARYLEDIYVNKRKVLDKKCVILLDHYRETRHNTQYGFGFGVTGHEAKEAIKNSKEFYAQMKKITEIKK